ncbi:MAG: hypothetical protein IT355_07385 [Gemmatimonadaceae bacterium]|nr:hypothetical protein [Gemmatimonadaceae bacterium]
MTLHVRSRLLPLVVTVALVSCRTAAPAAAPPVAPPPLPAPSVTSQWVAVQGAVLALVAENRTAAADSSLQQFAREFARTNEGDRARWWRALMRADQRAATGDPTLAIAQIDSLLADSLSQEIRAEATIIRRNFVAIDSVRRLEVRRRTQATQTATERLDELKTTRDSLGKLQAEIDRLRRRLRP